MTQEVENVMANSLDQLSNGVGKPKKVFVQANNKSIINRLDQQQNRRQQFNRKQTSPTPIELDIDSNNNNNDDENNNNNNWLDHVEPPAKSSFSSNETVIEAASGRPISIYEAADDDLGGGQAEVAKEEKEEEAEENSRASGGRSSGSRGLRGLQWLTNHLMHPFNQTAWPTSPSSSGVDRRSSLELGGSSSNQRTSQSSSAYLSLIGLAQRYFGRSSNCSSTVAVNETTTTTTTTTTTSCSTTGGSRSAPTTPMRSTPAKCVRFKAPTSSVRRHDRACQTNLVGSSLNDERPEVPSSSSLPEDPIELVERLFGLGGEPEVQETPMGPSAFRRHGYSLIDYISNYLDTIRDRRVTPLNIEPGYLKSLISGSPPDQGEPFAKIMRDFEAHIMAGITHWQHPHFHAYFPAGNAYPSILADMLSDALGCVGFSWAASPAYTELEIIMLNWMGKMIGLPDEFLCLSGAQHSKGGGVIQGSASECVLVNLLAARHWAIERLRRRHPDTPDGMLLSRLVAYCSREAHSCVEKAAMIGFIKMRALETDSEHSLRGDTLERQVQLDREAGLEPFLVCATLGTTSCVSFDNINELGIVAERHELWLHVDAAYAGSALICPEFKYLIEGIERASSFNMNPNKWLLINFDCSLMWVKDRFKLTRAFVVDPLYLQHSFSDQAIDYRHWGIPLSRRFRALKLWFTIRNYGVDGLREYVRLHVRLAKLFASLIKADPRFTINNQPVLGLVCFRLQGSNALNQRLLSMINASGKLHMVPASLNGRYVIRFCVCDRNALESDIRFACQCISGFATELLESVRAGRERLAALSQQNTIDVSSVSLHTQQSTTSGAPSDPSERACSTAAALGSSPSESIAPVDPDVRLANSPSQRRPGSATRDAARQYLMRRSSRRTVGGVTSGLADSSAVTTEQSTVAWDHQDEEQLPVDLSLSDADLEDELADEDELELDLLADDEEEEEEDDDAIRDRDGAQLELGESELGASLGVEGAPEVGGHHSKPELSASVSPAASGHSHVRSRQVSSDHQEEAADELVQMSRRNQRASLRYKREFFVRMVSDPRVYRAQISANNLARASCSSLGGAGDKSTNQQQQQQQLGKTSGGSTSSAGNVDNSAADDDDDKDESLGQRRAV